MRQKFSVIALVCVVACLAGCSDSNGDSGDNSGDTSNDNSGDSSNPNNGQNGNGTGTDGKPFVDLDSDGLNDGDVCHDNAADLSNVVTRLMLLEDKSGSMERDSKWENAVSAISTMTTQFDSTIEFGYDLFNAVDGEGESCEVSSSVIIDVAPSNSGPIMADLNNRAPGNATPLLAGMNNYLKASYAPIFQDGQGQSYLVIVSDGKDTCGLDGIYKNDDSATAEQLGAAAAELLATRNIKTIVIGFGDGIDPEQLNAIAREGGTQFTEYLDAADGDELQAVLNTIAETVVVSCTYQLGGVNTATANLDLVNVYLDGVVVPRDDGCSTGSGWEWLDASRTAIHFCEQQCNMLDAQQVSEISIKIMCNEDSVVTAIAE